MADKNGDNPWQDKNHRFKAGNPGGPGNPKWRRRAEFHDAIDKAVKPEHLEAVMRKLLVLALEGDEGAARIVLERCLGKPADPETLEAVTAASAIWKLIAERIRPVMPDVADELEALLEDAGAAKRVTIRIG